MILLGDIFGRIFGVWTNISLKGIASTPEIEYGRGIVHLEVLGSIFTTMFEKRKRKLFYIKKDFLLLNPNF